MLHLYTQIIIYVSVGVSGVQAARYACASKALTAACAPSFALRSSSWWSTPALKVPWTYISSFYT